MPPGHPSNRTKRKEKTNFAKLIDENAVIIISTSKCCMCIIVKSLLVSLGINPKVFNVDKEEKNFGTVGGPWELPTEYIGGKYSGGIDKVMESRVNGELVPMLREDGVLWL
ncbi:hypothetical protein T459_05613 [Capsicum annuum]|uniref:Glutaredoxin domain-containing protein n=1 Tax=Capsicum annuum TaxID=4072 RepID=A0A2G3A8H6_CAPAN|nr:hypothetical protein T459_05613 [Capsicum annuum]